MESKKGMNEINVPLTKVVEYCIQRLIKTMILGKSLETNRLCVVLAFEVDDRRRFKVRVAGAGIAGHG